MMFLEINFKGIINKVAIFKPKRDKVVLVYVDAYFEENCNKDKADDRDTFRSRNGVLSCI